MINWIIANRDWLFSGLGITVLGAFMRWGYNRWRERPHMELPDARVEPSYKQVRARPLPTKLPGFVLRALYKPDVVRSQVKLALRNDAPGSVYLNAQVPFVDLYFQVTNLSAIDLVLDRMLVDVWFGQPTFSTTLLHRYVIPAGEITDGIHVRQALADNQKAQIVAFESSGGNSGSLQVYVTAYFESKLGRFFVQQAIERRKL